MGLSHRITGLGALCLAGSLSASAVYLVDFNTHTADGYPDDLLTWNAFAAPADVGGTLLDTDGGASSLTIGQTGLNDSNYPASNNTGPAWAWSDSAHDGAVGDFFFTSNDGNIDTGEISISGLTGVQFSVDIMAGGKNHSAYNGFYSYSLDGGTTWAGFTQYASDGLSVTIANTMDAETPLSGYSMQAGRYLGLTDVTLTSGDTFLIRGQDDSGTAIAFNALKLTTVTAVPEPALFATLMGPLVLLFALGRRRR